MPITTSRTAIEQVEQTLLEAHRRGASDIHLEPARSQWVLRLRVDGLLHPLQVLAITDGAAMLARCKVMANLDIAEKRLPQDGRCSWESMHRQGLSIDLRLSTLPTLFGEKLVIRLLNSRTESLTLEELGMPSGQLGLFRKALAQPQGLILVTGPTGAGKTSSLYAALRARNSPSTNLSTAEDPVEIVLPGINQVSVRPELGFDFAATLRALLRQDPDVIMVGEIRDRETATMALHAAQTGHLVLSTLHTNSATDTLVRLERLGVDRSDVTGSLLLVMAQRLVRRVCTYCRGEAVREQPVDYAGPLHTASDAPCPHCHDGYLGRVGLYEQLQGPMLDCGTNRSLAQQPDDTLWDSGQELVAQGITTEIELSRVLGQLR